jgi:ATP adenylyltransferase
LSLERVWAPWRLAYIKGDERAAPAAADLPWLAGADRECFLCRDAVDAASDRASGVVHRGPGSIAVLNRYPYNNGHLLVAPRAHVARFDQVDTAAHLECLELISRLVGALEKLLGAEGFNIGLNLGKSAGAGLPGHLHWHIVPRWNGDTNFMTPVADTRVISQSLDALWELLTPMLAAPGDERILD